jgi:hypothetical protein
VIVSAVASCNFRLSPPAVVDIVYILKSLEQLLNVSGESYFSNNEFCFGRKKNVAD